MNEILGRLRGGLIVSVQAAPGSALDDAHVLAAMARAAQDAGAVGLRMQGVENITAARRRVGVPMIGILKRTYAGFAPYVTPTLEDARAVLATGCEIVAFDATRRARPDGASGDVLVQAIHDAGALAMADCATEADGTAALAAGADVLATTLCGYTEETAGTALPALRLVRALASHGAFVVCEGGIRLPESGRKALAAGADAVVVGTAITGVEWIVREFSNALAKRSTR